MSNDTQIRTINLFEYSNQEPYSGNIDELETFLDYIWRTRPSNSLYYSDISEEETFDKENTTRQKFLFIKEKKYVKSQRYIGIIKINNNVINLLPKIFYRREYINYSDEEVQSIQVHILWWLSYCRKLKFPKMATSLKSIKGNLFEVLIYLFATYTKQVLKNILYQSYEDMNNELHFMKGRLDINNYIYENLSKLRWHKFSCAYDSFEFDNQFNRIIKCVSKLLLGASQNSENKKILSEIVFIFDEVTDIQASYYDCLKVKINPLYKDMFTVLDYCKLFLSNSLTYSFKNDFKVFAFLLPMEYAFEDFIYGFIEGHKDELAVKNLRYQKSDLYLAELFENDESVSEEVFNLQHDIYFEYYGKKIVCDTKYKLTYTTSEVVSDYDKKHGVSQSDLYQMASYAIRRKSKDVFLIYPKSIQEQFDKEDRMTKLPSVNFQVTDEFSGDKINIRILKVPIIHCDFPQIDIKLKLESNFEKSERHLINALQSELVKLI